MRKIFTVALSAICSLQVYGQVTVTIDTNRAQKIDGFGACMNSSVSGRPWYQQLFYNDARLSIMRMDLSPQFKAPYATNLYNSPWYGNNPALPGQDNNNVRTYTGAADYSRLYNGVNTPIAVMDTSITDNILLFDYTNAEPAIGGLLAQAGLANKSALGDFKLYGSIWSPEPWVKVTSGNTYPAGSATPLPVSGTPFPFIWAGNFAGGKVDVTDSARTEFYDGVQNTSALTQFARSEAAYIKGFQDRFGVSFYAISIQNELDFEEYYVSCIYPLAANYIAAVKAVRTEFNKYPDLANIKIIGPEDVLGGDGYGMWQYGSGATEGDKNLQFLTAVAADTAAAAAVAGFCIHGYAADGVASAGAAPTSWNWWANGWTSSPGPGLPANVSGFTAYHKPSWMTETSGEDTAWLSPANGFPSNGAFSITLKIYQALTTGQENGWLYWQLNDGGSEDNQSLTDSVQLATSAKYNALKHFACYIRPNAVRLLTNVGGDTTVAVSAFIHDTDRTLTIVAINSDATPQTVVCTLPALPFTISSFNAYTSSNNSYWQSATHTVANHQVSFTIPAYGVVTLVGSGTTTGVNNITKATIAMDVYPNPSSGVYTVHSAAPVTSYEVTGMGGQQVRLSGKINATDFSVDLRGLPGGTYMLIAKTAVGVVSRRLVKE